MLIHFTFEDLLVAVKRLLLPDWQSGMFFFRWMKVLFFRKLQKNRVGF